MGLFGDFAGWGVDRLTGNPQPFGQQIQQDPGEWEGKPTAGQMLTHALGGIKFSMAGGPFSMTVGGQNNMDSALKEAVLGALKKQQKYGEVPRASRVITPASPMQRLSSSPFMSGIDPFGLGG